MLFYNQNQTLMELQNLVEENKVALEEANQRICSKETLLEQVQSELQSYKGEWSYYFCKFFGYICGVQ